MDTKRIGNFTSSEIYRLLSQGKTKGTFGAPALEYIQEKKMERRLGRPLNDESTARPLLWGKLLEPISFDLLPTSYSLNSDQTLLHPEFNFWAGTPDGFKYDPGKTVMDEKCPYTLKSFCNLVDPLYDGLIGIDAMNAARKSNKDAEKYYWQLVSNACITGAKYAELIVYMPYKSELASIKEAAQNGDGDYYWIAFADENRLPYILDEGFYHNINIIRFEVPEEDKNRLTDAVERAGKLLFC